MNALSHMVAGVCFMLIAVAVLFLGLIEGSPFAGFVGAMTMLVIAVAFFRKGETLGIEEDIGRKLYRGNLN